MSKAKSPQLTETQVRNLATGPSFERGRDYYVKGMILEPVRQGKELRAECSGSEEMPYRVRAILGEKSVAETSCTCRYDRGGACKHVVALLLSFVHNPRGFRIVPPLEGMLANRSNDELVALIREMLRREPALMSLVELSESTRRVEQGEAIDAEPYKRQARRAMRHDDPRAIESELRSLRDAAARLAKAKDWVNAGELYNALLDETVSNYGDELRMMDEEGDIALLIDELAQGLILCLKKGNASDQARLEWLESLLAAELTEIEFGGIEFAPSAYGAVQELARDDEWARIEELVRTEVSRSRGWQREMLVELLASRKMGRGRANEADEIIREMGTPEQNAFLLARERKTDEALRLMREILKSKPGLAKSFADAFVEAGEVGVALELATERARHGDSWCADWLAKYYLRHGTPQEALDWQERVFLRQPSVSAFKALRKLGRKVGRWEEVRAAALATLERQKKIDTLIEIALDEGDVARALELLPRIQRGGWRDFKREVAKAAEKDHPQQALALYRETAERSINERTRGSYKQAAHDLARMRAIFIKLKAQEDWEAYLREFRARHANLPALQDEMQKARLWQ